jgi:hypothetical protein
MDPTQAYSGAFRVEQLGKQAGNAPALTWFACRARTGAAGGTRTGSLSPQANAGRGGAVPSKRAAGQASCWRHSACQDGLTRTDERVGLLFRPLAASRAASPLSRGCALTLRRMSGATRVIGDLRNPVW